MLLVGVTGSIGMGKSTVAQMFKEHGYGVYNADDTVHYIYENDGEVIEKVEKQFPGSTKNGVVNRLALRDILNKDPDVEGFNLGTNIGKVSGQSILHCHFHLIPRRP